MVEKCVQDLGDGPLAMRTLKNSDMQEFHLEVGGQRVLSAALAYGFRHIQNLTRKVKGHSCPYDIVEIMACPSGAELCPFLRHRLINSIPVVSLLHTCAASSTILLKSLSARVSVLGGGSLRLKLCGIEVHPWT